jgi:hypothetical protein
VRRDGKTQSCLAQVQSEQNGGLLPSALATWVVQTVVTARLRLGLGLSRRARYKIGHREPTNFAKPMNFGLAVQNKLTLVRELDSNEISEVMRSMFVRATKTNLGKISRPPMHVGRR